MGLLSESNGNTGPGASLNAACAALSELTSALSFAQQRSNDAFQDTKVAAGPGPAARKAEESSDR